MEQLVIEHGVVSWEEKNDDIISWDRWIDTCHVMQIEALEVAQNDDLEMTKDSM